MQKSLLSMALLCWANFSFAQQWATVGATIHNTNTGNVGIGLTAPAFLLDLQNVSSGTGSRPGANFYAEQTAAMSGTVSGSCNGARATHTSGTVVTINGVSGSAYHNGSGVVTNLRGVQGNIVLEGSGSVAEGACFFGTLARLTTGTLTNGYGLFLGTYPAGITNKWGVYVSDASVKNYFSGSVAIGTTVDFGYKLAVNGSAIFTEAKVKLNASWPDYVFSNQYTLIDLHEVEQYIKENKHLPNMPSADDVAKKNGFELGDMSVKLLQKIEELTLYLIDLKKENEQLKRSIQHLETNKEN